MLTMIKGMDMPTSCADCDLHNPFSETPYCRRLLKAIPINGRLENCPIAEVPSAEKRGEWKTTVLDHEAFGVRPMLLYCSCCNRCVVYPTRYCPNCGARMEIEG